jgi:hypothetical protein
MAATSRAIETTAPNSKSWIETVGIGYSRRSIIGLPRRAAAA